MLSAPLPAVTFSTLLITSLAATVVPLPKTVAAVAPFQGQRQPGGRRRVVDGVGAARPLTVSLALSLVMMKRSVPAPPVRTLAPAPSVMVSPPGCR
jgi:hypothetical protein